VYVKIIASQMWDVFLRHRVGGPDRVVVVETEQSPTKLMRKTTLVDFAPLLYCCCGFSDRLLWPSCVADADIIFLPCDFYLLFYSSPNLSGRRLDVYHTSTCHDVALVRI